MALSNDLDDDRVNSMDVDELSDVVRDVGHDPKKGLATFRVKTVWQGRARSETTVQSSSIGGKEVARSFSVASDEPAELLGENSAINPQELLMAALNSCLMVSYVAVAAVKGIEIESIEIYTEGELDLRGFLGIDRKVPTGWETLRYAVRIKGDGTVQEFEEIHETVKSTSPNYFNLSRPVRLEATLSVG